MAATASNVLIAVRVILKQQQGAATTTIVGQRQPLHLQIIGRLQKANAPKK